MRPACSFDTHSSNGWVGARAPISSPRRTNSRNVKVRGHTSGTLTATSRTCSRAMPITRSAARSMSSVI